MTITVQDRIERDTRALAIPRGRRVGQPGHDVARQYLLGRLTEMDLMSFRGDSFELSYTATHPASGRPTRFSNLVAVIPGTERGLPPLLVGAHYDSVIDYPCADDNATAVAATLSIAEAIQQEPLRRNVVIALFDAEEPPFFLLPAMGSRRFYEDHCTAVEFSCAVIMDLIGHDVEFRDPSLEGQFPEIRDLLFVLGSESHGALPPAVESAEARVNGLRVVPTLNSYIGDMSDHHAFRVGGQPYLFLTCGQGRLYHQPQDDMDWINLKKVGRVCRFVLGLLVAIDRTDTDSSVHEQDQAEIEIRMIERALGSYYPVVLERLGLSGLSSRRDLDRVAYLLRQNFVV